MAQYDADLSIGYAGLEYDLNTHTQIDSFVAEGDMPFGIAVVEGTNVTQAIEPVAASLAKDFRGVTVRTHAVANPALAGDDAYSDEEVMNVMKFGKIWVRVEHAVTTGDRVYFRSSGSGQDGEFRADGDGTAQVTTITPTAVNDTLYRLQIGLDDGRSFEFEVLSDGSATATEIVTALNAAIALETELTGLVTGSGTTTLILTGDAGVGFQATSSDSAGTLAIVLTTALASECVFLPNARYVVEGSTLAVVELN